MFHCSTDNLGCNGGNYQLGCSYLATVCSQCTETAYPSAGVDGTCMASSCTKVASISTASPATNLANANSMMTLLSRASIRVKGLVNYRRCVFLQLLVS